MRTCLCLVLILTFSVGGCSDSSAPETGPATKPAAKSTKPKPATPSEPDARDDEASASPATPKETTPAPDTSLSPVDGADAWSVFEPEGHGFAVESPGKPFHEVEQDEFGVDTHSFTAMVDETEAAYTVMYNDFADEDLTEGPKAVLDGIAESLAEDLKSRKEISLDDHPGMHYVLQFEEDGIELVVMQRVYLVKNRMYQAIVGVPVANLPQAEVDRFLDSFKLTNATTGTGAFPTEAGTEMPVNTSADPDDSMRTWVEASGERKIEAALVEQKDGTVTLKRVGRDLETGTHRAVITKLGDSVTFGIDVDNDGPTPDDMELTVPDIKGFVPELHSKNTHAFFGGGGVFNEVKLTYDPVRPEEPKPASVPDKSMPATSTPASEPVGSAPAATTAFVPGFR